ncbi:MAG TPA: preprotein translocase subunit YajC [Chitinophagales bacterium]|nr:preprotein translocase subunit YajC [Chitinophagales bacterium]HMU97493.1 preprotein translocase subunit YajC [Chitinophagales bacterium]HMV01888.1 preprotein translocase subunit YajC [Chitinophagales bacterium]HMW93678.1 preprotein translocase subunit YajC [Chitinophagales bacterium]HMY43068.1 preprotein translocase subunit YajC [Chitinophagales bacterium]
MFQLFILQQQAAPGNSTFTLIMFGLMFVVFYFFLIRPQSKKAKEQEKYIADLKVGDKIVTIAGIHGKIVAVNEGDNTFSIQVDSTTKMKIERSSISLEMSKKVQDSPAS